MIMQKDFVSFQMFRFICLWKKSFLSCYPIQAIRRYVGHLATLTHNSLSTQFRNPYNSPELGAIAVFLSKPIFICYVFVIQ